MRNAQSKNHPFGKKSHDINNKIEQYQNMLKLYGPKSIRKKQKKKLLTIKTLFKSLEKLQDLIDPSENLADQIGRDQKLKNNLITECK